jgi:hypothetical protein
LPLPVGIDIPVRVSLPGCDSVAAGCDIGASLPGETKGSAPRLDTMDIESLTPAECWNLLPDDECGNALLAFKMPGPMVWCRESLSTALRSGLVRSFAAGAETTRSTPARLAKGGAGPACPNPGIPVAGAGDAMLVDIDIVPAKPVGQVYGNAGKPSGKDAPAASQRRCISARSGSRPMLNRVTRLTRPSVTPVGMTPGDWP